MTGPLVGFPDYQQYPAWRGVTLFNGTFTMAASATQSFGPFPTGNFASLRLALQSTQGGTQVRLFGKDALTDPAYTFIQSWDLRQETYVIVSVPLTWNYIAIDLVGAPAGTNKCFASAQPHNISPNRNLYSGGNGEAGAVGVLINNGATNRHYPTNLVPGLAHLWMWGTVNPLPLDLNIMLRDYQGNEFQELSTWHAPNAVDLHALFVIPEQAWNIRVVNNSGAAQTYWISVAPVISGGG